MLLFNIVQISLMYFYGYVYSVLIILFYYFVLCVVFV
jgi:hypothetical protein